ncbi:hypothetical protein ABFS83_01G080600 [Erythranthe nasuta]
MRLKHFLTLICIINLHLLHTFADDSTNTDTLETYIIHVDVNLGVFARFKDFESWYTSFLLTSISHGRRRIVYSYRNVFKGFAARLSADEAKAMENNPGFISGSIIGVLDYGIFPSHPSFSDEGMPPPPAKWKGKCQFNQTACNNKIIGARYFDSFDDSPLDEDGHGSHTTSIAAGSFVAGANVFRNANGTASGIAPMSHLAIYKLCSLFCFESDILAGMDVAIDDGVVILSISLGGRSRDFYRDSIALGAFSAMEKGILVSCSAGNRGPFNFSTHNEAPWILTVGASTIDRKIRATALLGNNPSDFPSTLLPLVYAGSLNTSDPDIQYCTPESLTKINLRGMIVVCESGLVTEVSKGEVVKNASGAAMILVNHRLYANMTFSDAHILPATDGTIIGDERAPVVAAFSSTGPNSASPGILKPDIIGPGNNTNMNATFNIISGTSMSCPHLSGVAALLKSVHPDWSPAAIKSAIMTTADVVNLAQNPIEDERFVPAALFATGSGHVNPSRASDPGLIYDLKSEDYVPYLCGLNYKNRQVGSILQRRVNCSVESIIEEAHLNYPLFAISFDSLQPISQTYTRLVTNVGEPVSSYIVEIPTTLDFTEVNQIRQYQVTFTRLESTTNTTFTTVYIQGYLPWNSGKYSVRTPIAVTLR